MTPDAPCEGAAPPSWGSFSIRQNGVIVAGGSGPYEAIKREAAHYAAMYRQDGEVQVRVRRLPSRGQPEGK